MTIAETARLRLRHFHIVDGEAMDQVFGDAEVMRFGSGTRDPAWVRQWLRGCLEDYHAKWGFGLWAVVEKQSAMVIGFCGLSRFADVGGQAETEIGYRLAQRFWGQGYATEAASAVRDYGFRTLNLSRMISIIDPRNAASLNVAKKVGLACEKEVMFHDILVHVYAIERAREHITH
jgi:ribosomal-protein-alanine N-acetyltransferase